MSDEISIRKATTDDLPAIRAIMNEAVLNSTAIYDYYERDENYVLHWWEQLHQQQMPILSCVIDGRCVGYGTFSKFRPKDGYRFCVEHSVYIDKDFRGRGTGGKLLKALIDLARSQGYHTMVAGIDGDNKESIRFHEKFGFVQVGYMKEVGYKFDRWLDLVFMQLTFPVLPTGD
ncbi:MAG TPA: GNAT family N-acetyltransferase [Arachidicoccus sp.]|nr:GNAT family N-acetyltransferase [Arachidicoccus sp.]